MEKKKFKQVVIEFVAAVTLFLAIADGRLDGYFMA